MEAVTIACKCLVKTLKALPCGSVLSVVSYIYQSYFTVCPTDKGKYFHMPYIFKVQHAFFK